VLSVDENSYSVEATPRLNSRSAAPSDSERLPAAAKTKKAPAEIAFQGSTCPHSLLRSLGVREPHSFQIDKACEEPSTSRSSRRKSSETAMQSRKDPRTAAARASATSGAPTVRSPLAPELAGKESATSGEHNTVTDADLTAGEMRSVSRKGNECSQVSTVILL
jgi:hypothetical protein